MTDGQTDGQIGPYLLPRLAELTSDKKFILLSVTCVLVEKLLRHHCRNVQWKGLLWPLSGALQQTYPTYTKLVNVTDLTRFNIPV